LGELASGPEGVCLSRIMKIKKIMNEFVCLDDNSSHSGFLSVIKNYYINNENIQATYQPEFYTDLGMTYSPQITYTNLECSSSAYKLSCSFKITLENQVGT
jgi:hypothetical protein